MLLKRICRGLWAAAAMQQIGRGHRRRRREMVLEEPDLIDAGTLRQFDLFELALKHFLIGRIFARGGGRARLRASWLPPLPLLSQHRIAAGRI